VLFGAARDWFESDRLCSPKIVYHWNSTGSREGGLSSDVTCKCVRPVWALTVQADILEPCLNSTQDTEEPDVVEVSPVRYALHPS
jgi:hypothetical protein